MSGRGRGKICMIMCGLGEYVYRCDSDLGGLGSFVVSGMFIVIPRLGFSCALSGSVRGYPLHFRLDGDVQYHCFNWYHFSFMLPSVEWKLLTETLHSTIMNGKIEITACEQTLYCHRRVGTVTKSRESQSANDARR